MELNSILPEVKERTINVTQVAKKAGISRATYYQMVKNPERSSLERLRNLAAALGYKMIISFEQIEG